MNDLYYTMLQQTEPPFTGSGSVIIIYAIGSVSESGYYILWKNNVYLGFHNSLFTMQLGNNFQLPYP